jgi:orotidine-5'-phosphate decarboxylase
MAELILALDVTEKKQALKIAHTCAQHIDAIKIGYPLILSCGLAFAGELEPLTSRLSLTSRSLTSPTRTG